MSTGFGVSIPNSKKSITIFLWIMILVLPTAVMGQALNQPVPPSKPPAFVSPQNGSEKTEVTQKFGTPKQVHAPVGDPPIERWVYEKFTVYFEHSRVIHTVVHDHSLSTAQ